MKKIREKLYPDHDPYENVNPLLSFNGHGWASEHPAFGQVLDKYDPKLIVEVGTWFGGSARTMARHLLMKDKTDFEIVCVDTFCGSFEHWDRTSYTMKFENGRPNVYRQFISNVITCKLQDYITPLPVDSINASILLKNWGIQPDMIYIDAGHDYYSVRKDLENWSEILKPGGFLLGDDYHHPPIVKAADDVFGHDKVINMGAKFGWVKPL